MEKPALLNNELFPDPGYTLDQVIASLRQIRASVASYENDIYRTVADHLLAAEIPYYRECKLAPGSRIDFFIPGGIGIEIKKGMPPHASLISQLEKYTGSDKIKAVVLVVERKATIPRTINGKACILLALNKLWGLAV